MIILPQIRELQRADLQDQVGTGNTVLQTGAWRNITGTFKSINQNNTNIYCLNFNASITEIDLSNSTSYTAIPDNNTTLRNLMNLDSESSFILQKGNNGLDGSYGGGGGGQGGGSGGGGGGGGGNGIAGGSAAGPGGVGNTGSKGSTGTSTGGSGGAGGSGGWGGVGGDGNGNGSWRGGLGAGDPRWDQVSRIGGDGQLGSGEWGFGNGAPGQPFDSFLGNAGRGGFIWSGAGAAATDSGVFLFGRGGSGGGGARGRTGNTGQNGRVFTSGTTGSNPHKSLFLLVNNFINGNINIELFLPSRPSNDIYNYTLYGSTPSGAGGDGGWGGQGSIGHTSKVNIFNRYFSSSGTSTVSTTKTVNHNELQYNQTIVRSTNLSYNKITRFYNFPNGSSLNIIYPNQVSGLSGNNYTGSDNAVGGDGGNPSFSVGAAGPPITNGGNGSDGSVGSNGNKGTPGGGGSALTNTPIKKSVYF